MTMLTNQAKKSLKARAHHLKPVVTIGTKGLSDNVLMEIEIALEAHELLKLKLSGYDREQRPEVIEQIIAKTDAELIQTIGAVAVIYRESED